ncbi:MAG: YraN family protein [Candidatus Omnitrophica bacterium]|nr:YraN family protein [Candidatus Omnitrophota bacterium]
MRPSEIGSKGENLAAGFLRKKGLQILARNYRFKRQEVDIIAQDRDTICFVEVKTRTNKEFGLPEEAITLKKRKHLINLAVNYIKRFQLIGYNVRFDVVAINWDKKIPQINYIKNAFLTDDFWSV